VLSGAYEQPVSFVQEHVHARYAAKRRASRKVIPVVVDAFADVEGPHEGSSLLQQGSGRRSFLLKQNAELEQDGDTMSSSTAVGKLPLEIDMLVGTDTEDSSAVSDGNTLPQVKMPWGFNDWVPQTSTQGSWWFHRADTSFLGMRCTHQPSPWVGDYGDFRLLPYVAKPHRVKYAPGRAKFHPHLFSAMLSDAGRRINFELAPTEHAAILRLTFDDRHPEKRFLRVSSESGYFSALPSGGIAGYTDHSSGGAPNLRLHVVIEPRDGAHIEGGGVESNDFRISRSSSSSSSNNRVVVLAVGTSFISSEQAVLNLKREVGFKSIEEVANEGSAAWQDVLGTVEVHAMDEMQRRVFYTNLWKAALFPRKLHEVDVSGKEVHYSPYTGKVEPGKLVADIGMWDAYVSTFPMLSVFFPKVHGEIMDGLVNAYSESGWLPEWPSPGERGVMVGTMGDAVLADAITKCEAKRARNSTPCPFNVQRAYEAIRKDAFEDNPPEGHGRAFLQQYRELGFVPQEEYGKEGHSESVSVTLGYMLADAAIASAALALGHGKDAAMLQQRSLRYNTLFNNGSAFFQPKDATGQFTSFDPLAWKSGFTEGGPWQYRFFVPHDVGGLQKLFNGSLCKHVGEMLQTNDGDNFHVGGYGNVIHEMREARRLQSGFGFYAHSNQPVHHALWVAKKAGCTELADRYLRRVMSELYTLHGYAGDEDNGEMASWYILSAIGLYQLEPGKLEFVVGSPLVENAIVRLPEGRVLEVTTEGQGKDNVYVAASTWTPRNGSPRPVKDNVLNFSEVMDGGTLHFAMRGKF